MQNIKVEEVKTSKDLKKFINLPDKIYGKNHPHYVKPLNLHMKMMIGKLGSPKKHLFLAYNNDEIVARIGIKVNKYKDETTLHFGFFEAMPGEQEAVNQMISKAHSLYPELKMRGPYNFRMEDPYIGVLVDGFEEDPYFLMSYNPDYYSKMLEEAKLYKSMDLITYAATARTRFADEFYVKAEKAKENGITVRWLNPKDMKKEVRVVAGIFNEALEGNWGFEEMYEQQVKEMYLMFKLFLDHRIIAIAQKDGKDIGCLILLPNYNPVIKKAGGKLSLKFLLTFLFDKKNVKTSRGYALGVLKAYHGLGVGTALINAIRDRCVELGKPDGEISWILSNNDSMNGLAQNIKGKPNKIYRVFDKDTLN